MVANAKLNLNTQNSLINLGKMNANDLAIDVNNQNFELNQHYLANNSLKLKAYDVSVLEDYQSYAGIEINAVGNFANQGRHAFASNQYLNINAQGDITNDGTIFAKQDMKLNANLIIMAVV